MTGMCGPEWIVVLVIIVVIVYFLVRWLAEAGLKRVIIFEYERGLKYVRGKF